MTSQAAGALEKTDQEVVAEHRPFLTRWSAAVSKEVISGGRPDRGG